MNIFPYSNFHDLNLDWLLQQVKQLRTDVDGLIGSATPYNATPEMDGTGAPGSSVSYARGDHQHPTDTSRASATDLADEVAARTNKDLALDGDIAAVDAKIHFSASNPLMDGSPSAGFSTDQARADHIHPTDTSRASAADLTQEISDRGIADTTLQNNINAVDAKIVLATGAPLMDSSSATPGSSTSMARADHVHPTDTSRASESDFQTLKARVDGFTGSANPSDTAPLMDGAASAGTGANYSRGDHVHPSDTSKLNKSGDTMTGYLVQEMETRQKTINAIGWLRVINVPNVGGTMVEITLDREGDLVASESHKIIFTINDAPAFSHEISISSLFFVDKIRYSDAGYIDIHIDENYTSKLRVTIKATNGNATPNIHVTSINGIAVNPAGESILTTYNLHGNGMFVGNIYSNGRLVQDMLLPGPDINSGDDLDSYRTPGCWSCQSSAVASTLTNCPTTYGFKLIVMQLVSADRKTQFLIENVSSNIVYKRYWSGGTWQPWEKFDTTPIV